jgi:hypothetical protein
MDLGIGKCGSSARKELLLSQDEPKPQLCKECGAPSPRFKRCTPCVARESAKWLEEQAEKVRIAKHEAGLKGAEVLRKWREERKSERD